MCIRDSNNVIIGKGQDVRYPDQDDQLIIGSGDVKWVSGNKTVGLESGPPHQQHSSMLMVMSTLLVLLPFLK